MFYIFEDEERVYLELGDTDIFKKHSTNDNRVYVFRLGLDTYTLF